MSLRGRSPKQTPVTRRTLFFLVSFFVLSSCSPATPLSTPQAVSVYSTLAAQPWLPPLYDCAESLVVLSRVEDAASADIVLRVGEPAFVASPAYQIDEEEIWIVTHRESPILDLSLEELQALFMGQGDPTVQIWVYPSGEDVQEVFDQVVMAGRSVAPSARVAAGPEHMLKVLESERQAIGILPLTWSMKMNGSRAMYHVATVPVLIMTNSEPQGVIQELIACLQK